MVPDFLVKSQLLVILMLFCFRVSPKFLLIDLDVELERNNRSHTRWSFVPLITVMMNDDLKALGRVP